MTRRASQVREVLFCKKEENELFELLTIAIFIWLLIKSIGLAFKLTWGVAKIAASILIGLAFPVLIVCLVFVGGIALLLPIIMIAIAAGVLKACV